MNKGPRKNEWYSDPQHTVTAGWGLCASGRDLARIGCVVLSGGEYGGRRIVSREWIRKADLLDKYKDYDTNPAAESFDKVMARFEQPWTVYYFISADKVNVGVIRVVDKKDGSRKRISPITGVWIRSCRKKAISICTRRWAITGLEKRKRSTILWISFFSRKNNTAYREMFMTCGYVGMRT